MRRLLPLLVLLAAPAYSQTSISPKLGSDLEKFYSDQLPLLQKVQTVYYEAHGRYWQGILTPASLPDETTKERTPDLKVKPTDQEESWEALFKGADILPPKWPAQLQIDVYDGPRGKGWTVTLRASEGGKPQVRTWNFGPEKERDTGKWAAQAVK